MPQATVKKGIGDQGPRLFKKIEKIGWEFKPVLDEIAGQAQQKDQQAIDQKDQYIDGYELFGNA
jgi:hypothetical protein